MAKSKTVRGVQSRPTLPRFVELVRVSGRDQYEKDTPAIQRSALERWRERHPGVFVERIEHSTNISGALGVSERPDLQRLKQLADAKAFDEIRVFHLDRLTRADDPRDQFEVWGFAKDAGALILDCQGTMIDPNTEMGKIQYFFTIHATAEERKKILVRTHNGRARVAGFGRKPAGTSPYGLLYDVKSGLWSIDETKAAIVRKIFDWCCHGISLTNIIRRLDEIGALTVRGNRWTRPSLYHLLRNAAYYGESCYVFDIADLHGNDVRTESHTIKVPAIISRETWEQAQAGLRGRRTRTGAYAYIKSLLRGRVVCGVCGRSMTVWTKGTREPVAYYRCASMKNEDARGIECTHRKYHSMAKVDAIVWAGMQRFRDPARLEAAIAAATAPAAKSSWQTQMENCETQLEAVKKEERSVLRLLTSGLSEEACQERLKELTHRRKVLTDTLEVAQRHLASTARSAEALSTAQGKLRELVVKLDASDFETQRTVFLAFTPEDLGAVKIFPDRTLKVQCALAVPGGEPLVFTLPLE